jgi:diaminopimelate decarboxylase
MQAGELRVGGLSISDLAAQYGAPLYLYDSQVCARQLSLLRSALPPEFTVYYSVKANPNAAFLRFFLANGCGLEVASAGEFSRALAAGCPPDRILYAGPGKTEVELDYVLSKGIGEIHVESLLEIERISAISRRLGRAATIALRVNPGSEAQGGAMRMGGKPAPFGIDEECVDAALDRILPDPALNLSGVHLFTGTQILDAKVLLVQYCTGIEIARRVATRLQRPLSGVDFGGGLGIPYFANEQELDMAQLRLGLAELMTSIRDDARFAGTRFLVEPGRYLAGESGIYLTRVNDLKRSRGKKFVVVDGGMHQHLAASGNLGQVIKRNYPLAVLNKLNEPPFEPADVVGPLCTPLDVLARDLLLPQVEVGDLIGVFQSGAYARSASPLGFLSHPAPAEVWIEEGRAALVCPRGAW